MSFSPRPRGNYRGRVKTHTRHIPKVLLIFGGIVLGIFVILALITLWLQRYMVYSETGGELVLPWEDPAAQLDSTATEDLNIVEEEGSGIYTSSGLRAAEISIGDLLSGKAPQILDSTGANALIIEMKAPEGTLYWASGQSLALSMGVISPNSGAVTEILSQLSGDGVYLIAKLCCFQDNALGGVPAYSLKNISGGFWSDGQACWTDPANTSIRDYLCGLAAELPVLGFDEILLTHAAYPFVGNLSQMASVEPERKAETVASFYEDISLALTSPEHPVPVLSVEADTQTVTQMSSTLTGQSSAQILSVAQRIWTPDTGEDGISLIFTSEELLRGALVLEVERFGGIHADLAQGILLP